MEEDPLPPHPRRSAIFLAALGFFLAASASLADDNSNTLANARIKGVLTYGTDAEGGGPYIYPDLAQPRAFTGFEVDLMNQVASILGAKEAEPAQGPWDKLLPLLDLKQFDVVVNGYELNQRRLLDHLATRPYYVYQLQLIARQHAPIHSMADLSLPRPGGGYWQIGVLAGSAADAYAQKLDTRFVKVVPFDGATNAMMKVRDTTLDATLQDLPAAIHYTRNEFTDLALIGPPEGCGYYVMYVRKNDVAFKNALDQAIGALARSGKLRAILDKYHIWNDAQTVLEHWTQTENAAVEVKRKRFDMKLLIDFMPTLLMSAGVTIGLACTSFPLAIVIGLLIAIGRMPESPTPRWLRWLLAAYVEVIRGTPMMLQLFVLFYVLPEMGIMLSPWFAGILGLAINYSAYEAEIYRAGLQAVHPGQMEAAKALGMTQRMALRRVKVPQAVRIVIPTVTSDFIALFKDTSVCSVLTITELTKRYYILSNNFGGVVEFGIATALLYLAMSLPLTVLSRKIEAKFDGTKKKLKGVLS